MSAPGAVLGGHGVRNRELSLPVRGGPLNSLQQRAIKEAVRSVSGGKGVARSPGARQRGSRFE